MLAGTEIIPFALQFELNFKRTLEHRKSRSRIFNALEESVFFYEQQRLKMTQIYFCKNLRNFYYQNYSSLIPVIELKNAICSTDVNRDPITL